MTRAARATRIGFGQVVLLGLASGLSAFGMASVIPALPVLGRAFDTDAASLQWVVSAYLFGLGIAQPIQGWFADRFGRRPVLLTGFAVFAVASIAASLAPTLPWLVAARFAQGLGVSVATVVARAIVRDTQEGPQAAISLSFITAVMGLAPVIAPLAGGIVVGFFDWHALFLVHLSIAVLLLAWMIVALAESRPVDTERLSLARTFTAFGELLRLRRFLAYSLVYSFTSGAAFAFITVGATLYERLFRMAPAAFGVFWATLALAYALGATIAGVATRRWGERGVLLGGGTLGLVGGICFVWVAHGESPSFAAFSTALAIQLVANGIVSPLSLAGAVNESPRLAGTASGLSSALAMFMSIVFAIASGALFDGTPVTISWLLGVGTLLALVSATVAVAPVRRVAR